MSWWFLYRESRRRLLTALVAELRVEAHSQEKRRSDRHELNLAKIVIQECGRAFTQRGAMRLMLMMLLAGWVPWQPRLFRASFHLWLTWISPPLLHQATASLSVHFLTFIRRRAEFSAQAVRKMQPVKEHFREVETLCGVGGEKTSHTPLNSTAQPQRSEKWAAGLTLGHIRYPAANLFTRPLMKYDDCIRTLFLLNLYKSVELFSFTFSLVSVSFTFHCASPVSILLIWLHCLVLSSRLLSAHPSSSLPGIFHAWPGCSHLSHTPREPRIHRHTHLHQDVQVC